jgi:hypothetical protein
MGVALMALRSTARPLGLLQSRWKVDELLRVFTSSTHRVSTNMKGGIRSCSQNFSQ